MYVDAAEYDFIGSSGWDDTAELHNVSVRCFSAANNHSYSHVDFNTKLTPLFTCNSAFDKQQLQRIFSLLKKLH